ncbi:MAG: PHB depolymerase family esterase, partial [Ramlibacter sp.]
MNPLFQRLMQDATRLTQGGDLRAATAAIQAALAGAPAGATPATDAGVIDVVARVVGEPGETTQPRPAQPAPHSGDRFIAGSFAGQAMQRDYKLYIPPSAGTRPLPLVVMLHGCTQNPDDFAAGTAMNALARA